jgi:hypothetical protein
MNQIKVQANLESASVESTDGKRRADIEKDYCIIDLRTQTLKFSAEDFEFLETVRELREVHGFEIETIKKDNRTFVYRMKGA